MLQAFWFYRPSEVPEGAWRKHAMLQQHTEGTALYKLPDTKKLQEEEYSERQVSTPQHEGSTYCACSPSQGAPQELAADHIGLALQLVASIHSVRHTLQPGCLTTLQLGTDGCR